MKYFFAGKRWYLRRFRGVVEPPAQYGGQGTTWQQHPRDTETLECQCGEILDFTAHDYVIREQEHNENCELQYQIQVEQCPCPVTDARYVKICPQCRRGHWKQAV